MSNQRVTALCLGLALVAGGAGAGAEDKEKNRETFMATVLQQANMRLPGGGTFQLTMNVDEWTSVEERKRLIAVFKEGGSEALMKELQKTLPYTTGPQRLIGVRQWKDKKKDKDKK
jgi:hypothetical protein